MHGAEGAEYGRFVGSVEVGSEREVERLPGVAAADAVDVQPLSALEVFHGGLGGGAVVTGAGEIGAVLVLERELEELDVVALIVVAQGAGGVEAKPVDVRLGRCFTVAGYARKVAPVCEASLFLLADESTPANTVRGAHCLNGRLRSGKVHK